MTLLTVMIHTHIISDMVGRSRKRSADAYYQDDLTKSLGPSTGGSPSRLAAAGEPCR